MSPRKIPDSSPETERAATTTGGLNQPEYHPQVITERDVAKELFNTFESREIESQRPLKTGLKMLDALLKGLYGLVVIEGPHAVWKTWLAKMIAENVAEKKTTVLFFTYEQCVKDLETVTLARLGKIDLQKIIKLRFDDEDWGPIASAIDKINGFGQYLKMIEVDHRCTPDVIRATALNEQAESKSKQVLIVVDYLQLVQAGGSYFNKQDQMRAVLTSLRRLSRELTQIADQPCSIFCVSSSDKPEADDDSVESITDIKTIADTFITLSEPFQKIITMEGKEVWQILMNVRKNQFGKPGKTLLLFTPAQAAFEEAPEPLSKSQINKNQTQLFK